MFILVEAGETFTGKPKDFIFETHQNQFRQYPIRYIKIPRFPSVLTTSWQREQETRNALAAGLEGLDLKPNDIIMLSDVDEIPRASTVQIYADLMARNQAGPCCVLNQDLSYYYVNCRAREPWHGTRMIRYDHFTNFQTLRESWGEIVPDAGWHFSYLGGPEKIREKIGAYTHMELDRPEFTNDAHIEECMQRGVDCSGRAVRGSKS